MSSSSSSRQSSLLSRRPWRPATTNRPPRISSSLAVSSCWTPRRHIYHSSRNHNPNPQQSSALLRPHDLTHGQFRPPAALSPTSILEFQQCPQSFFLQYVLGLKPPPNVALVKGLTVHAALERWYDDHENPQSLQDLFDELWQHKYRPSYAFLFEQPNAKVTEAEWMAECLELLDNYQAFDQRQPPQQRHPPMHRQLWCQARLEVNPEAMRSSDDGTLNDDHYDSRYYDDPQYHSIQQQPTFLVRGVIDRLDLLAPPRRPAATGMAAAWQQQQQQQWLRIGDYKTGQVPKRQQPPNDDDNLLFTQLLIYALLLHRAPPPELQGQHVRYLRLLYLASSLSASQSQQSTQQSPMTCLDYDLGATQAQRSARLHQTHVQLAHIWRQIQTLCATGDALAWKPCSRPYCFCHECRPRFAPGTLAEHDDCTNNNSGNWGSLETKLWAEEEDVDLGDDDDEEEEGTFMVDEHCESENGTLGDLNDDDISESSSIDETENIPRDSSYNAIQNNNNGIGNATPTATASGGETALLGAFQKLGVEPSSKDLLAPSVRELVSFLDPDSDWRQALRPTLARPELEQLADFLARERRQHTIYPSAQDTWAALNHCPLNQVKVVILGQDPYHGPGQAHGLSFSVLPDHRPLPPSLRNIFQELQSDPRVNFDHASFQNGHLLPWAQQGVLLLNSVLTVRQGQAASHKNKGWEQVTLEILKCLRNRDCVFLAWGKPALERVQALHDDDLWKNRNGDGDENGKHVVIATSHPSPLSANKTTTPFLSSRCFSRCNQALIDMGLTPIDWQLTARV